MSRTRWRRRSGSRRDWTTSSSDARRSRGSGARPATWSIGDSTSETSCRASRTSRSCISSSTANLRAPTRPPRSDGSSPLAVRSPRRWSTSWTRSRPGSPRSYGYPPTREQGFDLIARTPVLLARYVRRSKGLAPVPPRSDLDHAANYLWMLFGTEPEPRRVAALQGYLDLLADHGMNASTFSLRVTISTQSDLVSAATGALGTLKGPVHGGAPSKVSEMLDEIRTADRAATWVQERLARKEVLYG